MPRAATSVATNAFVWPDLNASKTLERCAWVLPPCSAPTATPTSFIFLVNLSAPCFVLTKKILFPFLAAIWDVIKSLCACSIIKTW